MPYMETEDGVPIHYVDEGPRGSSGIFLIPGETLTTNFWKKNIPELARRFRVVAMDVRGRGESGKTDSGHSLAQFARDFRQMLEVLGLERVVAVGWSLGGSIIWSYIQQFGEERLSGYVNVDQRPARPEPEEVLREQLDAIQHNPLRYSKEGVVQMLGPEAPEEEDVVNWMAYERMKTPAPTHSVTVKEAYYADWRPFLPQVRLPTLVCWAKYGHITPEMAKSMNEAMPNSKLIYFERSGHALPWSEPEKFNAELATFAEEVLPATGEV